MNVTEAAGWVGGAIILGGYALSVRKDCPRVMHWANAIGCVGTVASAAAVRAWPNLVITGTFGVLGWWGIWETRPGHEDTVSLSPRSDTTN